MRQRMRAFSHGFKVRYDCITRYSMAIQGSAQETGVSFDDGERVMARLVE